MMADTSNETVPQSLDWDACMESIRGVENYIQDQTDNVVYKNGQTQYCTLAELNAATGIADSNSRSLWIPEDRQVLLRTALDNLQKYKQQVYLLYRADQEYQRRLALLKDFHCQPSKVLSLNLATLLVQHGVGSSYHSRQLPLVCRAFRTAMLNIYPTERSLHTYSDLRRKKALKAGVSKEEVERCALEYPWEHLSRSPCHIRSLSIGSTRLDGVSYTTISAAFARLTQLRCLSLSGVGGIAEVLNAYKTACIGAGKQPLLRKICFTSTYSSEKHLGDPSTVADLTCFPISTIASTYGCDLISCWLKFGGLSSRLRLSATLSFPLQLTWRSPIHRQTELSLSGLDVAEVTPGPRQDLLPGLTSLTLQPPLLVTSVASSVLSFGTLSELKIGSVFGRTSYAVIALLLSEGMPLLSTLHISAQCEDLRNRERAVYLIILDDQDLEPSDQIRSFWHRHYTSTVGHGRNARHCPDFVMDGAQNAVNNWDRHQRCNMFAGDGLEAAITSLRRSTVDLSQAPSVEQVKQALSDSEVLVICKPSLRHLKVTFPLCFNFFIQHAGLTSIELNLSKTIPGFHIPYLPHGIGRMSSAGTAVEVTGVCVDADMPGSALIDSLTFRPFYHGFSTDILHYNERYLMERLATLTLRSRIHHFSGLRKLHLGTLDSSATSIAHPSLSQLTIRLSDYHHKKPHLVVVDCPFLIELEVDGACIGIRNWDNMSMIESIDIHAGHFAPVPPSYEISAVTSPNASRPPASSILLLLTAAFATYTCVSGLRRTAGLSVWRQSLLQGVQSYGRCRLRAKVYAVRLDFPRGSRSPDFLISSGSP